MDRTRIGKHNKVITESHVRSIIKSIVGWDKAFDFNTSMNDIGISVSELESIQKKFVTKFSKTVGMIYFSDTVTAITMRLNNQTNP